MGFIGRDRSATSRGRHENRRLYFSLAIVIFIFFKRLAKGFYKDQSYIAEADPPLTFSEVEKAFSQSKPPQE